ncbi:HD domain-containing protein [Patescibacteria group bacterium]|nr:HD domain-containing protein [Patescibacteria group bacterium]MBU2579702.1 HD domain-containing protein [Patescibacteria group bacterium]
MKLPKEIKDILGKLEKGGFEAYAVGGCVRDILLGKKPKDWDITTKAKPEEIQGIFPDSFYANKFGTVTVKTESEERALKEVEITTFRTEQRYTDKRHPDKVSFTIRVEKDLSRRDFTINALALNKKGELIDLFGGQEDIKKRLIKAVRKADNRFGEDALRMLRAIRFTAELGSPAGKWQIETQTLEAIKKNAAWLQAIAKERIRDELIKMIMADEPEEAIELLRETGLLKYIIPELEKGIGVAQNRHHIYSIYRHCVLALKFGAKRKYGLEVRLAALLHDIAKPQTKRGQGEYSTFYNHDIVGARFAANILQRLRFPKKTIEKVAHLVRNHMFVYGVDEVSETGVRRLLRRVGRENMGDLLKLRITDRLGSGCPKAVPYKLRHLEYLIEKVSKDPISVKMLKINGDDLMKILETKPGPKLGLILNALLSEALENPKINTKKKLSEIAKELNKLSDKELKTRDKKIKEKKEEVDSEMKGKYWVK